jgi:hypothetical protein
MKTLTELSGSVIRMAAAAIAEAKRSLPADEKPAAPAQAEAPPQGAEAATGEAPPETAAAPEASSAAAPTPPAPAEGGAAKEAIEAAVAKATGLSGDRLTMLHGAVEAVGRRTADVRLVRVFGLEEPVTGATKVGDHQFVVDLLPARMTQSTAPKDDRGRRGGGRGGGGGGGGGRGGGDRGAKGGAVGGFSMDSLREDRKNQRGGSGGPGGRRPGGGGGRGGPPGGGPKK